MLGALTPLGEAAHGKPRWAISATAFTVGGLLTSGLVGALLGLIGQATGAPFRNFVGMPAMILLAGLCAAREAGFLKVGLLQPQRATRGSLARRLGQPWAALLWGADIGLLFTTWFTFSGTWWLIALMMFSGHSVVSASILASYWGGRALTIWLGPWLVSSSRITGRLPEVWDYLYPKFRRIHAAALILGATLLAVTGP